MSEPSNGSGPAFSTKEMLIRIEGKVDSLTQTVASKNAWYDVEIALLKAGQDKLKTEAEDRDKELEETKAEQATILTRINVAAGAVGLILFLSPVIWILVNKLVGQ